jgi:hypothetical protein
MLEAPTTEAFYPPVNGSMELPEINIFSQDAVAAGTCGDDERGHASKGGSGMAAHMAYKQDRYYVEAAACYIAKMFKGAGGAVAEGGATAESSASSESEPEAPAGGSSPKGKGMPKGKGKGPGKGAKGAMRI